MLVLSRPLVEVAFALPENSAGNDCWIDSATGKAVPLVPAGLRSGHDQLSAVESGQAFIPGVGRNVVRDPTGNWIDSASGQPVNTIPAGLRSGHDQLSAVESGQAFIPGVGRNVVRVPCPRQINLHPLSSCPSYPSCHSALASVTGVTATISFRSEALRAPARQIARLRWVASGSTLKSGTQEFDWPEVERLVLAAGFHEREPRCPGTFTSRNS